MIIQLCGLSGSGKTTLSQKVKTLLSSHNIPVEIIDGDEYRKVLCADLGFSKKDRNSNIRRLAFVAGKLSHYNVVAIICAINPYDDVRKEITLTYPKVKTVFIDCDLNILISRDTKGLYKKAMLPDGHPDKIHNLTGVNDPFEKPDQPDLTISSHKLSISESTKQLAEFIMANYSIVNALNWSKRLASSSYPEASRFRKTSIALNLVLKCNTELVVASRFRKNNILQYTWRLNTASTINRNFTS
jgi:adenylylsulfate kinase